MARNFLTPKCRFNKKRHPLMSTDMQRAFMLIWAIKRPEPAGGGYGRDRQGRAYWYNQRHGKQRDIKNGQWAGPWRLASTDGVDPI